MKAQIGEEGTEQFTILTHVDGELIQERKIHDPLINSRTVTNRSRFSCFLGIFSAKHRTTTTSIQVRGTHSAERRIMTMDLEEMQQENQQWREYCSSRPTTGFDGQCAQSVIQ